MNIKTFKAIYAKRLLQRKEMERNLEENLIMTKDFVKKINLGKKPTVINP